MAPKRRPFRRQSLLGKESVSKHRATMNFTESTSRANTSPSDHFPALSKNRPCLIYSYTASREHPRRGSRWPLGPREEIPVTFTCKGTSLVHARFFLRSRSLVSRGSPIRPNLAPRRRLVARRDARSKGEVGPKWLTYFPCYGWPRLDSMDSIDEALTRNGVHPGAPLLFPESARNFSFSFLITECSNDRVSTEAFSEFFF